MNMQKIELGHTVLHEKTGKMGTVVDINKKRTEASILVQDLDDKGEVISETTVTLPLAELKVVKEIEDLGNAVEKAVSETVKETADTTKRTSKNTSKNMKQFTKSSKQKNNEALPLEAFRDNINEIINSMLQSLLLGDGRGFLALQAGLIQKINEAVTKEKEVALRTSDLEIIIAQVDALTDTNYFLNGSLVEIGMAPEVTLKEDLPTERFPLKNRLYHQVAEFHTVGGHPVADKPTVMTKQRMLDRFGYTVEELVEFIRATSTSEEEFNQEITILLGSVRQTTRDLLTKGALESNTATNQHKLLLEMLNSLNNMFATIKMPQGVFGDIVHNANMTKFYKNDKGEYYAKIRKSDGKIMKSPDFVAPEPLIEEEVKNILGM